jgi:predicted transcriptional regulator
MSKEIKLFKGQSVVRKYRTTENEIGRLDDKTYKKLNKGESNEQGN